MGQKRVLYVDDEENNLKVFYSLFKRDYEVSVASSAAKGMEILAEFPIEVIVTDQRMPQKSGVEFLEEVMQKYPEVIRIVLTGYAEMGDLIDAVNKGKIYHYLTKPWKREELKVVLDNAFEAFDLKRKNRELIEALREKNVSLEEANKEIKKLQGRLEAENTYLQSELRTEHDISSLIGSGPHFQRIIKLIDHVAPTTSTVLIQGETGTGKELIARAVHSKSSRSDRTLVKINCAALPATLIESELFGHERGAFTGALTKKLGLFEIAHEGTIFLDEVGELPIELQAKLLRVLQEGEFNRLGNPKPVATDVRVIAATNRDLQQAVNRMEFRSDLFYRLNVFPLSIPPLRDRKEDIPFLVDHFVQKFERKFKKRIAKLPKATLQTLTHYHWPGNIRELENVIERAMILSVDGELQLDEWATDRPEKRIIVPDDEDPGVLTLEESERRYIEKILKETNWKIAGRGSASDILKVKPSTLRSRMAKLGIIKKS